MRHTTPPNVQLLPPLLSLPRHLNIIIQNQSRQNQFNFIRRKEATRTRVSAVSKCEVRFIRCDELVARIVRCATALTQLVGAEAVKSAGFGVEGWVRVDCVRGDFEQDACGNMLAIGECDAFEDAAAEGCWG
jgi:hypothetical protein